MLNSSFYASIFLCLSPSLRLSLLSLSPCQEKVGTWAGDRELATHAVGQTWRSPQRHQQLILSATSRCKSLADFPRRQSCGNFGYFGKSQVPEASLNGESCNFCSFCRIFSSSGFPTGPTPCSARIRIFGALISSGGASHKNQENE